MKKKNESKKVTKAWPTKKAMEQVYSMNLWGNNTTDFYSGDGSHHPDIVRPYIAVVVEFLNSFKNPITVCDLGCGDFNIGKQLVAHAKNYIAIDIVTALIAFNKQHFIQEKLAFHCLDIAIDNLPSGDCAIVRQVLQHLSNFEIQHIVKKLRQYKYVILTEHVPKAAFITNKDIISGQGIRLKKQSGIDLLAPPFNFKVKEQKQLLSIPLNGDKEVIVTTLFTVY